MQSGQGELRVEREGARVQNGAADGGAFIGVGGVRVRGEVVVDGGVGGEEWIRAGGRLELGVEVDVKVKDPNAFTVRFHNFPVFVSERGKRTDIRHPNPKASAAGS